MIKVSLCMIVKNEEEVMRQCLDSVKDLCEEIIIVDTGSTDKTKEIAREYTDKVIDFKWIDDFSAARNIA
ncbi:SPBc2 prophage-derived glycosyltransferase SunS [Oceanobacillus oncorhynchi]|uniref:SPBc2 prophage-derived glycosyltransferase SunS n=1 Tax=Oceanobacillus oncorhynchi TaxID=545501 RepID=A0A0A1MJW2_9BACI|nr:SPBc2 prophage-derived glycosyltransferase SunS [Oceanobacillus oncorhynchi]